MSSPPHPPGEADGGAEEAAPVKWMRCSTKTVPTVDSFKLAAVVSG